jgi:hypothetical protein
MPVSGGGFEQSYNAQAAVDTQTMLVVAAHVSKSANDMREITPVLDKVAALPRGLGQVSSLLADTGYCSAANVRACEAQEIVSMLAMKRESHHIPLLERFAADTPAPQSDDPVLKMSPPTGDENGASTVWIAQANREAGVRHHQAGDGLAADVQARAGQGPGRVVVGDDGVEHQAATCAASGGMMRGRSNSKSRRARRCKARPDRSAGLQPFDRTFVASKSSAGPVRPRSSARARSSPTRS